MFGCARRRASLYAKTPGASALVVMGLATTIAIAAAFLSLWSVLEFGRPAGFEARNGLITIGQNDGRGFFPLTSELIERIDDEATTIAAIAGTTTLPQTLERDGTPAEIQTELVTPGYFEDVGPRVLVGRPFTGADQRVDAEPVAIISYALWQRDYGGDDGVLDTTIRITGRNPLAFPGQENADVTRSYRIVGVIVPGMHGTFQQDVEVWLPYENIMAALTNGGSAPRVAMLRGLARLAPGASVADARTELQGRFADVGRAEGALALGRLDAVEGVVFDVNAHRDVERQVRLFLAGSLLLMLTAACNVSLFLLSRAPGRRRELAIRMALGAPPWRVARQLLTEAVALVMLAVLLGVTASIWLAAVLPSLPFLRRLAWRDVTVFDWRVLAIVGGLALLVAVAASLAPATGLRRLVVDPGGQRTTARGAWGQRLAGTAQVALAAIVGAAAIEAAPRRLVGRAWLLGAPDSRHPPEAAQAHGAATHGGRRASDSRAAACRHRQPARRRGSHVRFGRPRHGRHDHDHAGSGARQSGGDA